ncbi:hypothetical protein CAC42_603 [Sphaceloma murrayae]|uniref:SUN domain-containing protein n=1 Tax=Sphaceloma murrayae TaxID=2082308 RepID=A0A2K1QJJ4_9PEZI|nr:hypothetical protein CAC42_603 [Sphaceloma murrayae]
MRLQPIHRCLSLLGLLSAEFGLAHGVTTSTGIHNGASISTGFAPTCRSGSINYITQKLPQQCALSSRTTPARPTTTTATLRDDERFGPPAISTASEPPSGQNVHVYAPESGEKSQASIAVTPTASETTSTGETVGQHSPSKVTDSAGFANTPTSSMSNAADTEETPLDTANFLSFEEWKKQNLAKAGQSPEHVGHHRSPEDKPKRPRPGNSNALDVLGEDTEIELDFDGFGAGTGPQQPSTGQNKDGRNDQRDQAVSERPPQQIIRSKDAGRTCKERTNYASFDCAATILKTNPECKSSSSVLVENKDSYMLNICSVKNKFFIVELCDDILIDTVVLANYEFFSSILRTFRLSVSDRYPAKPDKWRELGVYEARNTREVQPFLVEQSLIWARYLRIEILSHYGNEYYCPISLLRVHGTTMIEEFRNQEEIVRGEYPEEVGVEEAEAGTASAIPPQEPPESSAVADKSVVETPVSQELFDSATTVSSTTMQAQAQAQFSTEVSGSDRILPTMSVLDPTSQDSERRENFTIPFIKEVALQHYVNATAVVTSRPAMDRPRPSTDSSSTNCSPAAASPTVQHAEPQTSGSSRTESFTTDTVHAASPEVQHTTTALPHHTDASPPSSAEMPDSTSSSQAQPSRNATSSALSSPIVSAAATDSSSGTQSSSAPPRRSPTSPSAPHPSTQESFFKSLHKRLTTLESNASLSLQYIEHQSLLLRDAFLSHSKSQSQRTSNFLSALNSTVRQELLSFRTQYDELWQSTVIELEGQKREVQREMRELRALVDVLGREAVWQKRMVVVQSTLVLAVLGLVIFGRVGASGPERWEGKRWLGGWASPVLSPREARLGERWRWRSQSPEVGVEVAWKVSPPTPVSGRGSSSPSPSSPMVLGQGSERGGNGDSGSDESADEFEDSAEMEGEGREDEEGSSGSAGEDVMESIERDGNTTPKKALETQSSPATPTGWRDAQPVSQVGEHDDDGIHGSTGLGT